MSEQQLDDENCDNGPVVHESEPHHKEAFPVLVLGALGVVYGDIGTSPIYAFREALHAASLDGTLSRTDVLGVVSMIFWALTVIVTIKYVLFVLRADNDGEGGILSLMALARASFKTRPQLILALGIVGASLFYGDAVITPAISVLSAVEGLEIVTPRLTPFIVPITLVILLTLFSVQRFGTARVATIFGPITLLWFLAIGFFGLWHLADDWSVFAAVNPVYAVEYIIDNPVTAFPTIGTVFLAVTGAEALYADLGHFGRKPIATAWMWIVFPCLLLNYFGQGAFILANGDSAKIHSSKCFRTGLFCRWCYSLRWQRLLPVRRLFPVPTRCRGRLCNSIFCRVSTSSTRQRNYPAKSICRASMFFLVSSWSFWCLVLSGRPISRPHMV